MKLTTSKICGMGILGALAIMFAAIIRFPIFPQVAFLEYDMADVPIFLATFMYGTFPGIILTAVVCLIQGFTVSAASGIYGVIMHFLATGTYVLVSGLIYNKFRTLKGAIAALSFGVVAWVLVMIPANLFITPYFMGVSIDIVISLLLYIVLFNLVKAIVNSILTFLLYKRLKFVFNKLFDATKTKDAHNKSEQSADTLGDKENDCNKSDKEL